MIRVHDSIASCMGTIEKVYTHFQIVWYSVRLDGTGNLVNRRAQDLILGSTPSQYGVDDTAYKPVLHYSSRREPTEAEIQAALDFGKTAEQHLRFGG